MIEQSLKQIVKEALREVLPELLATTGVGAPQPGEAPYMDVKQAASMVGVTPGTIRTWIQEGRLKASKAGRYLRIRPADLREFLEGEQEDTSDEALEATALSIVNRRKGVR